VNQLVEDMGASHNNRLVSIIGFDTVEDKICYDVKRICRIRNHVLLVNKMFLEYRGRQAFNTINMDVGRPAFYDIEMVESSERVDGKKATVILTTSRKENNNVKRRDWIINKMDLIQFLTDYKPEYSEKFKKELGELEDKILLEDMSGIIGKNLIKYTKQSKDNKLLLKIQLL
jgi:hypothetical protein